LGTGVADAKLAEQKVVNVSGEAATLQPVVVLDASTWKDYNGWFLDLPAVGERLLKPMGFHGSSNILTVFSQVPAKGSNADANVESCDSITADAERQYLTFVNIMDGRIPSIQIVDLNNDGVYDATTDRAASRVAVSPGAIVGISGSSGSGGFIRYINAATGAGAFISSSGGEANSNALLPPVQTLRPSWRQLR